VHGGQPICWYRHQEVSGGSSANASALAPVRLCPSLLVPPQKFLLAHVFSLSLPPSLPPSPSPSPSPSLFSLASLSRFPLPISLPTRHPLSPLKIFPLPQTSASVKSHQERPPPILPRQAVTPSNREVLIAYFREGPPLITPPPQHGTKRRCSCRGARETRWGA
jgi:hypothetical protein